MSAALVKCTYTSNSSTGDPPDGWFPSDNSGQWIKPWQQQWDKPWDSSPSLPYIPDPQIYKTGTWTGRDAAMATECEAMAATLREEFADLLADNSQTSLFITSIPPNGFLLRLTTRHGSEETLQADSLVAIYKKTAQLMRTLCEYVEE